MKEKLKDKKNLAVIVIAAIVFIFGIQSVISFVYLFLQGGNQENMKLVLLAEKHIVGPYGINLFSGLFLLPVLVLSFMYINKEKFPAVFGHPDDDFDVDDELFFEEDNI